jgi:hypothetical protein
MLQSAIPGEEFYVVKLAGTDIVVPVRGGIIKGLMESRGEVSGAVGSFENGTPNTKVDVVFYVDTSTITPEMTPEEVADRWMNTGTGF